MKQPVIDIFSAVAQAADRENLAVLVIGGHAVNAYGYARTTLDADFLISSEDLPAWRKEIEEIGYRWIGQTGTFVYSPARPATFASYRAQVTRHEKR